MCFLCQYITSRHHTFNILLLLILTFFQKTYAQQPWNLKKDKNGVMVYTRQPEATLIKEYKAIMLARTSIHKAIRVITDGDNLWKWNHQVSHSKTIKKIAENTSVFWMKNTLSWPLKNRDLIARIIITKQKNGTVIIDIIPETAISVPIEDGTIRIDNFKGSWSLTPKGAYVAITQQLYGNPGGDLPAWIFNTMITNTPYHTFLNLKKILEK